MIKFDFTDKVALVTGASKGIGECIAKRLAEAGAKVALACRHVEDAQKVADEIAAKGGKAIALKMDIREEADVKEGFKKVLDTFGGRLDFLINNAGVTDKGLIEDKTLEEWHRVIETDLTGTFLCTREAMPIMKAQRFGRIVVISSTVGKRMAYLGGCAYTVSKAGQLGFVRQISVEGAMYNVTCNAVNPGSTLTPLHKTHTPPETIAKKSAQNPMGRLGDVEDMAVATLFLCTEEAGYVNGADINVDGAALYNYMDSPTYHKALNSREY